ncbi:response regulator [Gemmiger formicilis]|uniref:response regulator n=1 Tax=Gemmiger formicilis TaxID=745368 RepID=UPI003520AD52
MTGVLLVDDEPLVLIGMQGMLNWAALGYEVVGTARNGAEALRAVQEKQPDIGFPTSVCRSWTALRLRKPAIRTAPLCRPSSC